MQIPIETVANPAVNKYPEVRPGAWGDGSSFDLHATPIAAILHMKTSQIKLLSPCTYKCTYI